MPRKTDSCNPADWLWLAASDLEGIRELATRELSNEVCRGKLAEVLRSGWILEKTHELERLLQILQQRSPDLVAQSEPLCDALAEVYFKARYPGFDLDDPDWPVLRAQIEQVAALHAAVQARVAVP